MRTLLVALVLVTTVACGKKKPDEAKPAEPASAPAAAPTGAAPAPQPAHGEIAGQKYKMNVRLGEQTAAPTLTPKDEVAPTGNADEAAALKAAAARAAAEKAAREATKPR